MAVSFTFTVNAQDAQRAMRQLKARAPRAVTRALNRSGASARTALVRSVAGDMGLKSSDVREQIPITDAQPERQVVTLRASSKRIPVMKFKASGPRPSRGRGRGVTARVQGARSTYPHAFIASVGAGHEGVFERKGPGRLPIRELFGPSIFHVAEKHAAAALERGREQLIKNLQHELKFALQEA